METQTVITTETEVLQDVMNSIHQLKIVMEDWQITIKNNSKDGEDYSNVLLRGYEAAMRQVDIFLGEY